MVLVKLDNTPLDNIFLMEYGSKNNINSQDPTQFNKLLNDMRSWLHLQNPLPPSDVMCPCGSGKFFKDCHGVTVAPIQVKESSEKIWKVGDYYNVDGKEGVVFWVDKTGKHGKIVSVDEANLRWCTYREFNKQKQIGASFHLDGNMNSNAVKHEDTWAEKYPSFSWCSNHGSQWYLPAYKELLDLFKNEVVEKVNNTLDSHSLNCIQIHLPYWSSTEKTNIEVFVTCKDSYKFLFNSSRFKHEMHNVRAVCAF